MSNEIEEYNKAKLAEAFVKTINGTCTQADAIEVLINGIIDLTVKDKQERESAKMAVSQAKERLKK